MALSTKQIIERGWKSTQTETGSKIFLALFLAGNNGKTQQDLRGLIEKELNKKHIKKLRKEGWKGDKLESEKQKGRKGTEYKNQKLHTQSIVWQYFAQQLKTYDQLKGAK